MGTLPALLAVRTKSISQLLPIVINQGVGDYLHISGQDLVKLVEGQADAVVGQAILGEIVGADPLAAVSRAD